MKRRFHSTDVPGYLIRRHLNALQKMVEDFAPTLIAAVTLPGNAVVALEVTGESGEELEQFSEHIHRLCPFTLRQEDYDE